MTEPSITCPKCLRTSYNINDVKHQYCGACHEFHDVIRAEFIMNNKTIQVTKKKAMGKMLTYPECANAHIFARMVRATTLSPRNLKLIEELGYKVEVK